MSIYQQAMAELAAKQKQRQEARLNYQLAQRPVTQQEILARELAQADAAEFPLDTPQGQIINPQLAAAIAEGYQIMEQQQQGSQALASELGMPASPQEALPMLEQLLKGAAPANPIGMLGQGTLGAMQGRVLPMQEQLPAQRPMVEAQPLAQELNSSPNADLLSNLNTQAIAQELMGTPATASAAQPQGFMDRLTAMFQKPETDEFIMQTLLALARSESIGDALSQGVAASRAKKAELANKPAVEAQQARQARKEEAEISRLDSQSQKDLADALAADASVGKLKAETVKLLKADEDKMDDDKYTQRWNDLYKNIVSGEFMRDDSELSLDSSELTTKLFNQNLKAENRRYQQLTANAENRMKGLVTDVESGKQTESELETQLRMYSELLYGPAATAELINRLKGTTP